ISVAGIYHHYPSKKRLLVALLDTAHQDLEWRLQAAADAGSDAGRGFTNMVEALVPLGERRREIDAVTITEASRTDVLRARSLRNDHELHDLLASTAQRAARDRVFGVAELDRAIIAILTMCLAPSPCSDPAEATTPEELAHTYANLALTMMEHRDDQDVQHA